jgi:LysM domain
MTRRRTLPSTTRAGGVTPSDLVGSGPACTPIRGALIPLHDRASRPDWVWIASWVKHTADSSADPHQASGVADDLWPQAGQRAWQYAGTFGNGTCSIRGLSVDIDVADSGVLATSGVTGTGPTEDPGGHPDQQTYTVQPGDTLSGIAAKLHTPGGWQAIFRLSPNIPNGPARAPASAGGTMNVCRFGARLRRTAMIVYRQGRYVTVMAHDHA